jgi:putative copper export protein
MTHAAPGTQPQPGEEFGTDSPLFVFVRALTFAGLLGVLGAVVFRALILARVARAGGPEVLTERAGSRVLAVGILAAIALALAGVLRLYAQSYATQGADGVLDPALVTTIVTKTIWGWGWLIQIAATVLVLTGFVIARRGSAAGSAVAMLGALALAVSPALSGHAVATPERAWLAVPNDVLHVIGAGGWMGSLFMLVAIGIPIAMSLDREVRGRAVSVLVNAFSPIALTFATLAAATGIISAWIHLGSLGALWSSDYGRILSIKLLVLLPVIALGAFNWLRVRPSLGDDTAANRIRRSATAEVAIGALVVVVTAVLVATPPAAQ